MADPPASREGGPPGAWQTDRPHGVRVVSVEETSQAYLADLRPEDLIVQINETPIRTIDDFARVSQALKGTSARATLITLRRGEPREIVLHPYSFPILRHWDVVFVPAHDIRFADPQAGLAYWERLAHGYEVAGDPEHALNAYLNALHNDPAQIEIALKVSGLLWQIAQTRLTARRIPEALIMIQQELSLLRSLFDQPLTDTQLESVRDQLQAALDAIRERRGGV